MTTVLEVIDSGTSYLEKRNIAEARLSMQQLVGHFLALSRVQLYLEFDRPLTESELIPIREALRKRGQGIPLQHILGNVEFAGLTFKSDERALIPRPETEELVDLICQNQDLFPETPRILDLGTGSGVIGLSLAHRLPKTAEVVLSDVSSKALSLAKENAEQLEIPATLVESSLFEQVSGTFDLIVANLPYIPESEREQLAPEVAHDPDLALFSGSDGLDLIRKTIQTSTNYLNSNSLIAFEVGYNQGQEVQTLLRQSFPTVGLWSDLNDIPRFPHARTKG